MTRINAVTTARDLVVLIRRLRTQLRAVPTSGLTPSQASVLLRLSKGGASSTTVLAIAEGVRSQSMTATLNSLDALGLLDRRPDPEDGRRQIITLSDAGRAQVSGDREGRHEWLAQAVAAGYTEAELRTITEALELLQRLVEQ
jgi:DNA-binding MarR family transcriptional regulator